MMTKPQWLKKRLANYPNESHVSKQECQEAVFRIYYGSNDFDVELALEAIRMDIGLLAKQEHYERCQMLKDILERFE